MDADDEGWNTGAAPGELETVARADGQVVARGHPVESAWSRWCLGCGPCRGCGRDKLTAQEATHPRLGPGAAVASTTGDDSASDLHPTGPTFHFLFPNSMQKSGMQDATKWTKRVSCAS